MGRYNPGIANRVSLSGLIAKLARQPHWPLGFIAFVPVPRFNFLDFAFKLLFHLVLGLVGT